MDKFGLESSLVDQVIHVINSIHSVDKIVLFGSRATGHFSPASDIDLALRAPDLPDGALNLIRHALEERVATPLKFDVIDFYRIEKESLRSSIEKEGVVIYESEKD